MTKQSQLVDAMIREAIEVCKNAYAPYSGFSVGCAISADNESIYTGANIENASFGLTLCAERVAASHASSSGCRSISKIVIASDGARSPCGACRQFLSEFPGDPELFLVDITGASVTCSFKLSELNPHPFLIDRN